MALVRAFAQPLLLSLLVAASLPASAQEEEPSGPPPLPTREYGAEGSADTFGTAADAPPGQAEVAEDSAGAQSGDQAQPIGPPAPPAREYSEEAGFGAPAAAPSGRGETVEAAPTSPQEPVPPQGSVDAVAPEAPADAADIGPQEMDALTEGLAEQLTGSGEAASPQMLNEGLEALPDEIAGAEGDPVPDTALDDGTEMLTGETASGDAPGAAEDSAGSIEDALEAPAEAALPEETLPEETPPEETPPGETALEEEQTQTAAADVAEPPEPAEPEAPVAPVEGGAAASGSGLIVYAVFDNTLLETRLFRVRAGQGETPEDVSTALDPLGAAQDEWISMSPDGQWLLLGTQRFDDACAGWPCLAVVPADLSSGLVVRTSTDVVHAEGFAALAGGGGLIVFPASGGPHDVDLWAVTRQGDIWSAPVLLTAESPFAYNDMPALSADGGRVVFDCGDQPYGQEGTAICEAATDGSSFRVVLTPQDAPAGVDPAGAHHHPDYAADGSIVFQSRWSDAVWRLREGAAPEPVGAFAGDGSPCVLADGRIVSLWTGRPGSGGLSEVKVMTPDGASYLMLLADVQVEQIGCGG